MCIPAYVIASTALADQLRNYGMYYILLIIVIEHTYITNRLVKDIFLKGSKNFYTSSLFFPRHIGQRIAILYAFVRIVDDFVDAMPQQIAQIDRFEQQYRERLQKSGDDAEDKVQRENHTLVINAFVALQQECAFEQKWIDAFFTSMRLDLSKTEYDSKEEILEYIYGSAEVIGLCAMRIVDVDPIADNCACLFGRALQYINFIRDLDEDNDFGRRYLPLPEGMTDLTRASAEKKRVQFVAYIRHEIDQFREWLHEGMSGLRHIPRISRIPIQTAGNVFAHIANKIYRDPFLIYQRKVGVSRMRIMFFVFKNTLLITLFRGGRRTLVVGRK